MRPLQESDVFHAIAHPARRAILLRLKDGERTASELAAPFDMTFAAISQQSSARPTRHRDTPMTHGRATVRRPNA